MARCPVVKAHDKLGAEGHAARKAQSTIRTRSAADCRRHEIENGSRAGLSLKFGFEDERTGTIAAPHGQRRMLWRNVASGRCPPSRAGQQNRRPNRNAASTTNRSTRRGPLEPLFCNRRSARSLRFAEPLRYARLVMDRYQLSASNGDPGHHCTRRRRRRPTAPSQRRGKNSGTWVAPGFLIRNHAT